ncbi:uncharacterized protein LOC128952431 [Oppia nitens]|uniref:uncharacterized protein LOC128952431 n=1 Tax=Oppia nitens TaxID=1686743 RepID=UPI0023DCE4AA|nr:uncharacterized protein LOC128952431 [Oppia nitens]
MKSIIIALALFGIAYGLPTLTLGDHGGYDLGRSLDLGGLSWKGGDEGSYGGYGKQILILNDNKGYANNYGSSGLELLGSYGGNDNDNYGDSSDLRHGNYAPMPQQQIKLVPVPVPVAKPYPVPVDKPYTVKVDRPYPVKIEQIVKKPYIAKVERPVIEKTIHVQTHKSYDLH